MFRGLMPAMVTPFDERGEVDLGATEAVVERFIEAGVDGISPLGSTGEFSHLTGEERKRFAEEVVGIVGGRVPLVVGVGSSGTREAVELARHAEGVGADSVLVVSPSLIARIAAECPNVSGLKDTVTEYFHTVGTLREVKRTRPDFSVLAGWE